MGIRFGPERFDRGPGHGVVSLHGARIRVFGPAEVVGSWPGDRWTGQERVGGTDVRMGALTPRKAGPIVPRMLPRSMSRVFAELFALMFLAALGTAASEGATRVPLLLVNGRVLAGAEPGGKSAYAEALLIVDGRIAAVGTSAEMESEAKSRGMALKARDLRGAFVLPGLVDAHAHVAGLGTALARLRLEHTKSADEIAKLVKEAVAGRPPGTWIQGRGWDQNDWPTQAFPTRAVLDRVAPDHPVWLRRIDGHAGWANSKAIELAGVTKETRDPSGGRVLRAADASPSGVFVDRAMDLIEAKVPPPTYEETRAAILRAAEHCTRLGLTAVHDAGIDTATLAVYREIAPELPLRVFAMLSDDDARPGVLVAADTAGHADGMFRVFGVKAYADGALGSRGAALLAPYADEPGTSGLLLADPGHLAELARFCLAQNLQLCTHAIGDRANRMVLDAYEAAAQATAKDAGPVLAARRFRIEHAQVIAPEDLPRFGRLGVIASMQPAHCTSDMPWAPERLGPVRIEGAYAWRRLLESGARLCLGSDFPVESADPLLGLYAAVTTMGTDGKPPAGFRPTERLTIEEAIRGFTADAAFASFAEDELGRIAPGYRADLSVYDRNLTAIPPAEIPKARCLLTIVDGRIVYEPSATP